MKTTPSINSAIQNLQHTGKLKVLQNAPIGSRGGKRKNSVPNGGWNVISLFLKSLKPKTYLVREFIEEENKFIELRW
jgi:hypothetical protein